MIQPHFYLFSRAKWTGKKQQTGTWNSVQPTLTVLSGMSQFGVLRMFSNPDHEKPGLG